MVVLCYNNNHNFQIVWEYKMLFKSKNDQGAIERAQKMYGAGINRGLAGFVAQGRKKKKSVTSTDDEIVLTTTENIPENNYRIIGMVFGTAADHQQAVKALRKNAQKIGADVIVSMRFDSNNSTVTAYGTAVKLK